MLRLFLRRLHVHDQALWYSQSACAAHCRSTFLPLPPAWAVLTTFDAITTHIGYDNLHTILVVSVQDVIARAGRFWGLYKRAGHRVLINPSGDLIVRPTFIEAAAQHMRPWSELTQPVLLCTLGTHVFGLFSCVVTCCRCACHALFSFL